MGFARIFGAFVAATTLFCSLSSTASAKLAELLITDAGVKKPIELSQGLVSIDVDRTNAKLTYDLIFVSDRSQIQEGTFYFALPREAYVHEFGMWVNGKYQGSAIVEAKAGRVAYETIVRRGVDPALLEWTAGNTFKMRVYPVLPGKETRVKLTIGMPASATGGALRFPIPLDFGKVKKLDIALSGTAFSDDLPVVRGLKELAVKATKNSRFKGTHTFKDSIPPDEISIVLKSDAREEPKVVREDGDEKRFFEAHAFPALPESKRPPNPGKTVVFWDYSLSEEEHRDARLAVLRSYLLARKPGSVDVYGFGQGVFDVIKDVKGSDPDAVRKAIAARPYDGGTRLDLAFDKIKEATAKLGAGANDLLLFTNGVDSFELFDFKRVKDLGTKGLSAFIVSPTTGGNDALLQRFAVALDAVVIDQNASTNTATFTMEPWRLAKIKISKNLQKVEAQSSGVYFPGDGVIVRGQVKKDGKQVVDLVFEQRGKTRDVKWRFTTDAAKGGDTVPRLWAANHLTKLLAEKRKNAQEIKAVALGHQLMSPFTVMVVLEFCEDYAEFKLPAAKGCQKRDEIGDFALEGGDVDFESADIGGRRKTPMGYEGGDDGDEGGDASESFEEDAAADDSDAGGDALAESFGGAGGGGGGGPDGFAAPDGAPAAPVSAAKPMGMKAARPGGEDDLDEIIEEMDANPGNSHREVMAAEKDTISRPYGFEKQLEDSAKGVDKLYAQYLKTRPLFAKIPYYYIFVADLFHKLKRVDLADLILSNVVEVRPGDARWLRIYAYNLIAWGKAKDTIPIYRAITELREEDPQSFRDFGLALEAVGQPVGALKLFEKVYRGKWDQRLEGMNRIIQSDVSRAANAALKAPNLPADARKLASQYANLDPAAKDKIVVTASWDTDNTDVDLHVVQPDETHVFFENMTPAGSAGTLSWDSTQGYGPEQYRNSKPMRGEYRVYLRYYAENMNALQDGTFARVDFKIVEKGVERKFTRSLFLKDQDEVRTVLTFNYADPAAPAPPPNFKAGIAQAKSQLGAKKYAEALKILQGLGNRPIAQEEAQRHFHLARAHLGLKQFELAEEENQRALALDGTLVAAHFNNACARSLAKDAKKAIFHLNLLADSLQSRPDKRSYFLKILGTDADLANARKNKDFNAVMDRLRVGH